MPYTKINAKFIKDLFVVLKNIKAVEENIDRSSLILVLAILFGYFPSGKGNKRKKKQMRLHQTKRFCTVKIVNQTKRLSIAWVKIFATVI